MSAPPQLWLDLGIATGTMHCCAEVLAVEGMPELAEIARDLTRRTYQLAARAIAGQPDNLRKLCTCGRTGQVHYTGEADVFCPGFRERS